jgi:hypothetical protein
MSEKDLCQERHSATNLGNQLGELLKCVDRIEICEDRLLVHLKASNEGPNERTIIV